MKQVTARTRAKEPYAREGYEPAFPRHSNTRRVLCFVTDEPDAFATFGPGAAPRNTLDALATAMLRDENSPGVSSTDHIEARQQVRTELEALAAAGLVERRDDGTYALTDAGWVERSN
jgi:hypothetical protein